MTSNRTLLSHSTSTWACAKSGMILLDCKRPTNDVPRCPWTMLLVPPVRTSHVCKRGNTNLLFPTVQVEKVGQVAGLPANVYRVGFPLASKPRHAKVKRHVPNVGNWTKPRMIIRRRCHTSPRCYCTCQGYLRLLISLRHIQVHF